MNDSSRSLIDRIKERQWLHGKHHAVYVDDVEEIMGDASTRKDEEFCGSVVNDLTTSTKTSPVASSEIQDNKFKGFSRVTTCSYEGKEWLAFLPDEIAPYLCKPEPVSVSLEKMQAVAEEVIGYKFERSRSIARCILDAAGVKYVD